MGVHTQGESGFFDEDPDELSAMVQNETIEQHETAHASNTVGKCTSCLSQQTATKSR